MDGMSLGLAQGYRAWGRGTRLSTDHTLFGTSLVPRPFPPPVFDRILYAKTEGKGLGERVTCVTSGRREGRHRGGGA